MICDVLNSITMLKFLQRNFKKIYNTWFAWWRIVYYDYKLIYHKLTKMVISKFLSKYNEKIKIVENTRSYALADA